MDTSSFSDIHHNFPDSEPLFTNGSTCDCYRVKRYGKLHFLKRLKSEFRTNPRYVAALQKEFETGYLLEHPHLVRYLSLHDDYLMTEYIDGETLGRFVDSHPDYFRNYKNALGFLSQLLDVVDYLHQHQIVHLDLKPDNILITRVGYQVKLTDLGYCYTDTHADTMGRTDKYAAPEQINGESVDARTDIYAIGRILQTLPIPSILNKVAIRCIKPSPQDRYKSVSEMVRKLRIINLQRRLRIVLPLCLSGVILLVGIAYYWKPMQSTDDKPIRIDTLVIPTPFQNEPIVEQRVDTVFVDRTVEVGLTERQLAERRLHDDVWQEMATDYEQTIGHYRDSVNFYTSQVGWNDALADFDKRCSRVTDMMMQRYAPVLGVDKVSAGCYAAYGEMISSAHLQYMNHSPQLAK